MTNETVLLKIIELQSLGISNRKIAKQLKLPERTLYNHLGEDRYKILKNNFVAETFDTLKSSYLSLQRKAIQRLHTIMDGKDEIAKTQIALTIVRNALTFTEDKT